MATITAKRILVIDERYPEVAQLCLETIANWEVLTACSGSEASLGFAAAGRYPLDVMMPGRTCYLSKATG